MHLLAGAFDGSQGVGQRPVLPLEKFMHYIPQQPARGDSAGPGAPFSPAAPPATSEYGALVHGGSTADLMDLGGTASSISPAGDGSGTKSAATSSNASSPGTTAGGVSTAQQQSSKTASAKATAAPILGSTIASTIAAFRGGEAKPSELPQSYAAHSYNPRNTTSTTLRVGGTDHRVNNAPSAVQNLAAFFTNLGAGKEDGDWFDGKMRFDGSSSGKIYERRPYFWTPLDESLC